LTDANIEIERLRDDMESLRHRLTEKEERIR